MHLLWKNRQAKDIAQKKSLIEQKLESSGYKAELEQYLREELSKSGWKDQMKKHCLGKWDL